MSFVPSVSDLVSPAMSRMLRRVAEKNCNDADHAVSNTTIRLWKKLSAGTLPAFENLGEFEAYAFGVCLRQCRTVNAKMARMAPMDDKTAESAANPVDEIENADLRDVIAKWRADLDRELDCIVKHIMEGWRQADIINELSYHPRTYNRRKAEIACSLDEILNS